MFTLQNLPFIASLPLLVNQGCGRLPGRPSISSEERGWHWDTDGERAVASERQFGEDLSVCRLWCRGGLCSQAHVKDFLPFSVLQRTKHPGPCQMLTFVPVHRSQCHPPHSQGGPQRRSSLEEPGSSTCLTMSGGGRGALLSLTQSQAQTLAGTPTCWASRAWSLGLPLPSQGPVSLAISNW